MKLNKPQIDILAKYFADISKILFGSTVVAFFIPIQGGATVTIPVFIEGFISSTIILLFSLVLKR